MKTYFYFLVSFLILSASQVYAQDQIYTVNNWSGSGVTQHSINPSTGSVSGSVNYAVTPLFTSTALAINPAGYLYSIPDVTNTGEFSVYSVAAYPTATQTTDPGIPTAPVLTGQIPSNGADVYFRRLGITPSGWAYMIAMEPTTGIIHFAKFLTSPTGGASDFTYLGTMTLSDGPTANFYNGDLAFDGNGTMYVLVNADQANGTTKIYQASAATVASATGPTSQTQLTYKATVYVPGGANFSGAVTGLAFASNGNLYLAAQNTVGGTDGLYLISKENLTGNIIATPTNNGANSGMGDLASSYFPTLNILPVNYNFIKAKIVNNELQISWETSSEKNNQRFDVEVSKDGTNFTKIGSVNSKALNGISTRDIGYTFAASMNNVEGVVGLSMLAFALIGLPLTSRRSRLVLMACMVLGIGMFAASCSKSQDQIEVGNNYEKVFVRLVQYDIDGKKEASEIKTAYKAD